MPYFSGSVDVSFDPKSLHLLAYKGAQTEIAFRYFHEPLKRSIQLAIAPALEQQFDVGGPGWEPLALNTVTRKNGNSKILVRTGKLKKAVGALARWEIGTNEAFFSGLPSFVSYGYYHEYGTRWMPSRPFLNVDEMVQFKVDEIFDIYVGERLMRIWGN